MWCASAAKCCTLNKWQQHTVVRCCRGLHNEYKERKAAGFFQAYKPLNTRELLHQVLLRLDSLEPRQAMAGYSCVPASTGLVDAGQLQESHSHQLDLLAAAAAADGAEAEADGCLPGEDRAL